MGTVYNDFGRGDTVGLPWGKIGEIGLAVADHDQETEVMHSHVFHELVLVRKGSGIHITDEYSCKIYRGDIFLIKPGCRHTYEEARNLKITNIIYVPGKLGIPLFDLKENIGYYAFFETHPRVNGPHYERYTLRLNEKELCIAEELIREMEEEQKQMRPGHEFYRKLAFQRLMGLIALAISDTEEHQINELSIIGKIIRYFELNYTDKIKMADLIPVCDKSPSSITRLFRKAIGQSPIDYLIALRLEKAAAMLRNTPEMSISAVAAASGFNDSNYFSKLFFRRFNRSPRRYRDEEQDNENVLKFPENS